MRNRWMPALLVTVSSSACALGAFYGDPPDERHPWAVHDENRPKPPIVQPGTFSTQEKPGQPPSDAIILFDGKDLSGWRSTKQNGGPAQWTVRDGYMEAKAGAGDIQTAEEFGDCQLHVEWTAPTEVRGSSQGRGNSGIFLMGLCEIQVLDNYNNPTYSDGYASSVYGVMPPMANALRPPGQYNVYDIIFRRPVFKDGKEVDPGYVTVLVNGVVTQDRTPLEGPTGHMKRTHPSAFPAKGPLKLQDHGNPVRFRNIWYRKLAPRSIEGGTDGMLTPEATMAKRGEIASQLRAEAQRMTSGSREQIEKLAESLCYQQDAGVLERVKAWIKDYTDKASAASASDLASKKDEVRNTQRIFQYLGEYNIVPEAKAAAQKLSEVIKAQKWDR